MNVYEIGSMSEKLSTNAYPGRGIVLGITPDGKKISSQYIARYPVKAGDVVLYENDLPDSFK